MNKAEIEAERKSWLASPARKRLVDEYERELANKNLYQDEEWAAEEAETIGYVRRLDARTDEEIEAELLERQQEARKAEDLHRALAEQMRRRNPYIAKDGELFPADDINPKVWFDNRYGEKDWIRPRGNMCENIKAVGRLKTMAEARAAVEKLKAQGYDVQSTPTAVLLRKNDIGLCFDMENEALLWNYRTERLEPKPFRYSDWDFGDFLRYGRVKKEKQKRKTYEDYYAERKGEEKK